MVRWTELTPPEWMRTNEDAAEQLKRDGVAPAWEKEYLRKGPAKNRSTFRSQWGEMV